MTEALVDRVVADFGDETNSGLTGLRGPFDEGEVRATFRIEMPDSWGFARWWDPAVFEFQVPEYKLKPRHFAKLSDGRVFKDPHARQIEFLGALEMCVLVLAGTKGGKTHPGTLKGAVCFAEIPCSFGWVVAPTVKLLRTARREFRAWLKHLDVPYTYNRKDDLFVCANGSVAEFHTADNPDGLKAAELDWCHADEASQFKAAVHAILLDRVGFREGRLWYTTTPLKGGGGPVIVVLRKARSKDSDFRAIQFASSENPGFPKKRLAKLMATHSKEHREIEYEAKIVGLEGQVFSFPDETDIRNPFWFRSLPKGGSKIAGMGIDLGKQSDYTSVTAMSACGRILDWKRWRRMKWKAQRRRLVEVWQEWGEPDAGLDTANVGAVVIEDLEDAGMRIQAFNMHSTPVKHDLVEEYQIDIETGAVSAPHPESRISPMDFADFCDEHTNYQAVSLPSGRVRYTAPEGEKDDSVVSSMIANHVRKGSGIVLAFASSTDTQKRAVDVEGNEEAAKESGMVTNESAASARMDTWASAMGNPMGSDSDGRPRLLFRK